MEARARTVQVERHLKYQFSQEERNNLASELANAYYDRSELESQLSSIKADFKGRIGSIETQIEKHTRKIRDGYEMREIECEVQFHTPVDGQKRIVRLDTGEEVAIEYMLPHERQEILPFVQPEPEPEPEQETPQEPRIWPKYTPETGTYDKTNALRLRKDLGDEDWFEILLLEVDEGSWQSTYEYKIERFERLDQPITDMHEADEKATCIYSAGIMACNELRELLLKKLKGNLRTKIEAAIDAIDVYRMLMEDTVLAEQKPASGPESGPES